MADGDKLKKKLSLYLSTLSDSAQQLLLRSLKTAQNEGKNDAASDLILSALIEIVKGQPPEAFLEEKARQAFFKDTDLFIAPVDHVDKVEARISRSSLDAIWTWILRDIASAEHKKTLQLDCNYLTDEEVTSKTAALSQDLHQSIASYLKKRQREIGAEQKIGNQLGGMHIYEDLIDVMAAKERLTPMIPILSRLPEEITSWTSAEGEAAFLLISRYVQQAPLKAPWIFSAVTDRLSSPRLKVQLSTRLSGSDDAIQVAATVYAPAVIQVVADMKAYLNRFEKSVTISSELETCVESLSQWHTLARVMDAELEIPVQSDWGKSITSMKSKLSERLEEEIETTPGLIRKALRAPKDGGRETLDENLLQDATRAVELFHFAERTKDSLALNAPITRLRKEIEQSFEILTTSLIERSRQASGTDIKTCRKLGEVATLFAKLLFDEDYAMAFRRQLKAAASTPDMAAAEA